MAVLGGAVRPDGDRPGPGRHNGGRCRGSPHSRRLAIMDRLRMASSRSVPAGQPPPVKVPGQCTRKDLLDTLLRLTNLAPIREWGKSGMGSTGQARHDARRARCVPDRAAIWGIPRSRADNPAPVLTCRRAGHATSAHDLLSSRSRVRVAGRGRNRFRLTQEADSVTDGVRLV
jgi:hypothetical protein